nr:MATH domain-containing protein At5g43560-like isoform X1 [Ipomoea batatas]
MATIDTEEAGVGRSLEGVSSEQQRCQFGEALAEWRSSEQVENGIPSTSPPFWDSDGDDEGGPKPSELFGKYTWKIDKFSQINKRELRSNAFEVGGYKWYILIYPQGCDVCNHLSLFLCVANHDKLLPGWSHFAQFTIAVVNKDPKKSKYSDTLHRFWKKEHDWGWKKFMELSKVLDGFIDADTLIIKAQVQVIRERADRPFRCLDYQYRRELVRVYLTNVEQICRRFVEERRGKLGKLIEDKARWSSFCAFWLGMDQNSRRRMSKEKSDAILKVIVKHFFVEKEVTSTLVMDSLYSGLKALEGQYKAKKGNGKHLDAEEQSIPIIRMEKDMFVLVEDVLLLLERAALEQLPPKDEKGPQNRIKDGASGDDFNKDSIERDERRLTDLGRRTIEIFVLAQIFSKIEVAYQEAVALKRQEELIREEEAAWMAEGEQKSKRGASVKEKKSKKKQGKQKRNNRKAKDKGKDERHDVTLQDKTSEEPTGGEGKDMNEEPESVLDKRDTLEEVSDISDSVDCVPEVLNPDSEDRDVSPVSWDTDTSEVHPSTEMSCSALSSLSPEQNGIVGRQIPSVIDDSSSTCSTDSSRSVVMNGPYRGNLSDHKKQKSPNKGKNRQGKSSCNAAAKCANDSQSQILGTISDVRPLSDTSGSCRTAGSESQATVLSSHEQLVVKEVAVPQQRKLNVADRVGPLSDKTSVQCFPRSPPKNTSSTFQSESESKTLGSAEPAVKSPSTETSKLTDKSSKPVKSTEAAVAVAKTNAHRSAVDLKAIGKPSTLQVPIAVDRPLTRQIPSTNEKASSKLVPVTSRPMSAPIVTGPRPTNPVVSMVQTAPQLARSVSAAGRLGPDPSPTTQSYTPQSYRNAMMGSPAMGNSAGFTQPHSPSSVTNALPSYHQPSTLISGAMYIPQVSQGPERIEHSPIRPNFSYGMVNHEVLQNGSQWNECSPKRDSSRSMSMSRDHPLVNGIGNLDPYMPVNGRSHDHLPSQFPAASTSELSGRQPYCAFADEFPHLDIINDLLDDELGIGMTSEPDSRFQSLSNCSNHQTQQFTFPSDTGMLSDMGPSMSSCRFERAQSYHDNGYQHSYSMGLFEAVRDVIPQPSPPSFANGQMDGLFPNNWQVVGPDPSYLGMRNIDSDAGYPYHVPEYSNVARGVNSYAMFRPSNGL